jgi:hypothetical protein
MIAHAEKLHVCRNRTSGRRKKVHGRDKARMACFRQLAAFPDRCAAKNFGIRRFHLDPEQSIAT